MNQRPAPWSVYTTPEFWDDPHVSAQMLRHHLDPDSPAASRRHEFIDRSADWLREVLGLEEGSRLLDVGCGPGLYAARLARTGVEVTGVDVSRRSLAHARAVADAEELPVRLIHGNYLEADLGAGYRAAILIYEDYCALSPDQRGTLLNRVRGALRDGGQFLFDVTAAPRFAEFEDKRRKEVNLQNGFWAPPPYVGAEETWTYPELRLVLERNLITAAGETREFWNWMQCLTPEEVAAELEAAGFAVEGLYGDVAGAEYSPDAPTFAVQARA